MYIPIEESSLNGPDKSDFFSPESVWASFPFNVVNFVGPNVFIMIQPREQQEYLKYHEKKNIYIYSRYIFSKLITYKYG